MSRKKLQHGERVRYLKNGRKMRGTIQEYLPMDGMMDVPVLLKKKVVWMHRTEVRKLPDMKKPKPLIHPEFDLETTIPVETIPSPESDPPKPKPSRKKKTPEPVTAGSEPDLLG